MKYALVIDGVVDTVSYEPVFQHVQTEEGWAILYEMEEVTQTVTLPDSEGKGVEHSVTRSVPKRDANGVPIGIPDPAWVQVPNDVFGGFLKHGDTFVAPPTEPVPPPSMTPLQFIDRLTDAEQLALATAAMTQPLIKLWYDKLLAADTVNLGDARLAQGVQAMVAAGLLTSARAEQLLSSSS